MRAAITWVLAHPETVALVVNSLLFVAFCFQRPWQPGKLLYWGGVIVLTVGLMKMRG